MVHEHKIMDMLEKLQIQQEISSHNIKTLMTEIERGQKIMNHLLDIYKIQIMSDQEYDAKQLERAK